MSEQIYNRQVNFVSMMVDTLLQRFARKQEDTAELICEETLMRTSGIKGINKAMDNVESKHQAMVQAGQDHADAVDEFNATYEAEVASLRKKALIQRDARLEEERATFEFKLRDAIGLVQLVGADAAFEVLQECREEIRDMGKE